MGCQCTKSRGVEALPPSSVPMSNDDVSSGRCAGPPAGYSKVAKSCSLTSRTLNSSRQSEQGTRVADRCPAEDTHHEKQVESALYCPGDETGAACGTRETPRQGREVQLNKRVLRSEGGAASSRMPEDIGASEPSSASNGTFAVAVLPSGKHSVGQSVSKWSKDGTLRVEEGSPNACREGASGDEKRPCLSCGAASESAKEEDLQSPHLSPMSRWPIQRSGDLAEYQNFPMCANGIPDSAALHLSVSSADGQDPSPSSAGGWGLEAPPAEVEGGEDFRSWQAASSPSPISSIPSTSASIPGSTRTSVSPLSATGLHTGHLNAGSGQTFVYSAARQLFTDPLAVKAFPAGKRDLLVALCGASGEALSATMMDIAAKFINYQTMIRKQQAIVPHHLQSCSLVSEIILESSVVVGGLGQMLMLPWNEEDPDVKNNFWVNQSPPHVEKILAQYEQGLFSRVSQSGQSERSSLQGSAIATPARRKSSWGDSRTAVAATSLHNFSQFSTPPVLSGRGCARGATVSRAVRRCPDQPTSPSYPTGAASFDGEGSRCVPIAVPQSFYDAPAIGQPPAAPFFLENNGTYYRQDQLAYVIGDELSQRRRNKWGRARRLTEKKSSRRQGYSRGGKNAPDGPDHLINTPQQKQPAIHPPTFQQPVCHPAVICRANAIVLPPRDVASGSFVDNALISGPCGPTSRWDSPTKGLFFDGWSLDTGQWTDPDGYISLSQKQSQKFHAWRRITELPQVGAKNPPCVILNKPRSTSIRQGFVGDCSFLSSLAVLAQYETSRGLPVISGILYPQAVDPTDPNTIVPLINRSGFYACRVFFNGVPRKVLLDDYVPVRKDGKLLSAHCSNKSEFWVTLLEKSFVKLMGGSYFMQGSNPGSDLYHLTGWIPETVPFRVDIYTGSPDTHRPIVTGELLDVDDYASDAKWESVWNQLYDGLENGKCVACLGTSEIADAAPSGLDYPEGVSQSSGIVARHAYSVLNYREENGHRLLFVKNPWSCVRWRGKFGPFDTENWTPSLQKTLRYNQKRWASVDDGCFWIEWSDVIKWFSHLYICWTPSCFIFDAEIHSKWERTTHALHSILPDDSHLVAFNPQFRLTLCPENVGRSGHVPNAPFEVWILLSRHVRERKRDLSLKYLAVHIQSGRDRVACPPRPVKQGIYSNGECTLVKLLVDLSNERITTVNDTAGSPVHMDTERDSESNWKKHQQAFNKALSYAKARTRAPLPVYDPSDETLAQPLNDLDFVLIVSQYSQTEEFNFTIRTYSHVPMTLTQLPPLLPIGGENGDPYVSRYLQGQWTSETAGGCSNNVWAYFTNPHVRLYLPYDADIHLFLECPEDHSVNLRLFPGPVATPRLLRSGKALTSGPYRSGCCVISTLLPAGCYTIIVSAFRAGDLGKFQLALYCVPANKRNVRTGNHAKPYGLPPACGPYNSEMKLLAVTYTDVVLSTLPYAYASPPLFGLYCNELRSPDVWTEAGRCNGRGFGGVLRLDKITVAGVSEHQPGAGLVQISVRLLVGHLSPEGAYPAIAICRRKTIAELHSQAAFDSADNQEDFLVIARSDLEGGRSEGARRISTAAQELYKRQGLSTLSLATLEDRYFPFYIHVSSAFPVKLTEGSYAIVSAYSSPECPHFFLPSSTEGDFTLQLISDVPLQATWCA